MNSYIETGEYQIFFQMIYNLVIISYLAVAKIEWMEICYFKRLIWVGLI